MRKHVFGAILFGVGLGAIIWMLESLATGNFARATFALLVVAIAWNIKS